MSLKYLLILVLNLSAGLQGGRAAAQGRRHTRKEVSIPEPPPVAIDASCYREQYRPLSERMQHYPFNQAAKVAIVSFRDKRTIVLPADSVESCRCDNDFYSSVPVPFNSRGSNSVFEEKLVLDSARLNSLTAALYNYDYPEGTVAPPDASYGCYYPHNAILFYDKRDTVFAYIELCFSCTGHRSSYERHADKISWCRGKIDLLKAFFSGCGIQTGTAVIPILPDSLLDPGLNTIR